MHRYNYANQWSYAPPTFPITSSCSTFIVIEVVLCHINFNFPSYPPQLVSVFITQGPLSQMTHVTVNVINLLQYCLQFQFLQCFYIAHRLKIWSHSYYLLVEQYNWKWYYNYCFVGPQAMALHAGESVEPLVPYR